MKNLRSISLTSSLAKFLKTPRMISICERNRLCTYAQLGFRSKRSRADVTSTLTEYIRDKKFRVKASFIDLQKPFETLDNDILLTNFMKMVLDVLKSITFRRAIQLFIRFSDETTS